MAKAARVGKETSETRARLIEATERVMLTDGYAAVSSRRVAKETGVTAALVHYYFPTLDDLFLAVLRHRADQQVDRLRAQLAATDRPLHLLWQLANDPARSGIILEFMALANHRKEVRSELAAVAERFRSVQVELLEERLATDVEADVEPAVLLALVNAVGQNLLLERSIGVDHGHAATVAVVERYLDRLEGPPDRRPD